MDTTDIIEKSFDGVCDAELRATAADACRRWLRGLPGPFQDDIEQWLLDPHESRRSPRDLAQRLRIPQQHLIEWLKQGGSEVGRDVYDVVTKRASMRSRSKEFESGFDGEAG